MRRLSTLSHLIGAILLCSYIAPVAAQQMTVAAVQQAKEAQPGSQDTKALSPEEKMSRRFPQPVRVGDLIGLPMLDERDSTLGFIQQVVRTQSGKILLVVNYRAWFGWAPFDWGRRPVGVPLEVVAILGRQVAALDMSRGEFAAAPAFVAAQGAALAPDEMIRIALTRR